VISRNPELRLQRPDGAHWRRGDTGFGMVEVVMAVVVLVAVSVAAIGVLTASAKSELTARQGDQGLLVASAAMENAAAYDCGATTVAPRVKGSVDTALLDVRVQRCHALGDATWPETDGVLRFTVKMSTTWVQFNPSRLTTLTRDNLRLRREVVVTWSRSGRARQRTLVDMAALPPDALAISNPGSVTVKAAGGTAAIELASGYRVQHTAGPDGLVRFPFLEFGSYALFINNLPSGTVSPNVSVPDVRVGF
jgi:Tfp pilus assembly protein PilV